MSRSDVDRLLELVWDMDVDLNMYLSGELAPSAMTHRILETCRRIRERALDDTAKRQVEDLERIAKDFSMLSVNPGAKSRRRSPGPDDSQLMKDLFVLRTQLLNTRESGH